MTESRPENMSRIEVARQSSLEKARSEDLLRIIPRGRRSLLDIGARDGHFSRLLTQVFTEVTALDLEKPAWEIPGVTTVGGDVTRLDFPDGFFDCVLCAEVLEHVADLEAACREIRRVARRDIVIGVPFEQDLRIGRTICAACRKANPPWGHVNSFTERRLMSLFPALAVVSRSYVGELREATNAVSTWLMDLAGNPWGAYDQDEPCIHCGASLTRPGSRGLLQRLSSAAAIHLNRAQSALTRPRPVWMHLVLSCPEQLEVAGV